MVINANSTHCNGMKCDYVKNNKGHVKMWHHRWEAWSSLQIKTQNLYGTWVNM